ncbi:hypothetical protein Sango_1354100 [Sesamum angolense]|uniref:Uncharacterized protein n=1 Tax=Sesamum angolense TaxID=2727404 RepID=A0AAE1WSP8_9LAMI|nr:hypothetical protein Sango_1354100 [Sesamum angolense]
MSGAQGAQPPESFTATTYESVEGGENKTRLDIHSKEDEGGIQIDKLQDKVEDAAGAGGPFLEPARTTTRMIWALRVPHSDLLLIRRYRSSSTFLFFFPLHHC